jgi:hypothetical protein
MEAPLEGYLKVLFNGSNRLQLRFGRSSVKSTARFFGAKLSDWCLRALNRFAP